MKFKGDIIITDPCYIDTKNSKLWSGKIDIFSGSGLQNFGFTSYIWNDTIYGDWSCTTYEKGTGKELGRFCADAGLVEVFLLDEVLKFNPEYNIEEQVFKGLATLIKDFDGDITYEVVDIAMPVDDDNEEYYEDQEAQIHGTGNINFLTSQTGF